MIVHRSANPFPPSLQHSIANVFGAIQPEFNRLFDQLGTGWAAGRQSLIVIFG